MIRRVATNIQINYKEAKEAHIIEVNIKYVYDFKHIIQTNTDIKSLHVNKSTRTWKDYNILLSYIMSRKFT